LELLAALGNPVVYDVQSNLDAIKLAPGVWGWRADFQQSCAQNPQTISVSPDGKKLSLDYAKHYWPQLHFEYTIVSERSNTIVLKSLITGDDPDAHQVTLTINFQDANTFVLTNGNQPLGVYGTIERCK
jgi:hypothetical protein